MASEREGERGREPEVQVEAAERRGGRVDSRRLFTIVPSNIKMTHFMPSRMRPMPPQWSKRASKGMITMWAPTKTNSTTENTSQKVSLMYVSMG